MASNFKISVRRQNGSLHLKLIGDFDGTSACELLNFLQDNCDGVARVLINTRGLKEVYPFGVDTFQNSLYLLKDRPFRLMFTGKNCASIAPDQKSFSESSSPTTRA